MNLFDAHFHLGSGPAAPEPPGWLVGGCLISRSREENEPCLATAKRWSMEGAIFIDDARERELRAVEEGAIAYKHLELTDRFDPAAERPILDAAKTSGKPFFLHANHHGKRRVAPSVVSRYVEYVCANYPEVWMIVAHFGAEHFEVISAAAAAHPRIMIDISCVSEMTPRIIGFGSGADLLRHACERLGPRKRLFGSDASGFGSRERTAEYEAVRNVLSQPDQALVLRENGRSLFGARSPAGPATA